MRRTREGAERTREAILDAAEQVFYAEGVAGGTLEGIARVAGVTRGAVYWHFANKLDIFAALGERAVLPHDEAMRALEADRSDDPLGALEAQITRVFTRFGRDERIRVRLTVQLLRCDYVGDMAPALHGHAALIHRIGDRFGRFFRAVPVPARIAGDRRDAAGLAFTGMVHGTLMLWLRSPAEFPLDTVGVANVRTFLRLLRRDWYDGHVC